MGNNRLKVKGIKTISKNVEINQRGNFIIRNQ